MPEDIRLPRFMVPSDLDPSMEPPPPMEREEVIDDGGDDDSDDNVAGEGEHGGSDDEDQDDAMNGGGGGGSDDEGKRSKKSVVQAKKASGKEKKTSSSSKDKKEKKVSSKDKKSSSKDTKTSSSSSSKVKKESSSSSKEKKSAKKDKESDDKKRKKPSTGNADDDAAVGATTKPPPSKVVKKEKSADVKSEPSVTKPSRPPKAEKKADSMAPDALNALLEKEIKWILANCQFEEMTTKTVRKLLEKRLDMDLRHHKASIKASVARVIAAMEDSLDVAGNEDATTTAPTTTTAAATVVVKEEVEAVAGALVKTEAVATSDSAAVAPVEASTATDMVVDSDEAANDEQPEPPTESSEDPEVKREAEPSVEQLLTDAERELDLSLSDSAKLLVALTALEQQVPAVERDVLAASALLPKLVALRAHEDASVSQRVAILATLWRIDDLVPAPQPVREEDILAMKETLEDAATSHDDVLQCLTQLSAVRVRV